jgi:hypothetical protein
MHCLKRTHSYVDHVPDPHSLNRERFLGATAAALAADAVTLAASANEPSLLRSHGMLLPENEGPIHTGGIGMQRSLVTLTDIRREGPLAGEANP